MAIFAVNLQILLFYLPRDHDQPNFEILSFCGSWALTLYPVTVEETERWRHMVGDNRSGFKNQTSTLLWNLSKARHSGSAWLQISYSFHMTLTLTRDCNGQPQSQQSIGSQKASTGSDPDRRLVQYSLMARGREHEGALNSRGRHADLFSRRKVQKDLLCHWTSWMQARMGGRPHALP